jgi:hypothetical protein
MVFEFINPKNWKGPIHERRLMSTAITEISQFDAENATTMTLDFLKRLGRKGNWLPMKVSIDGELYVVEMAFQRLTAKVQINSKTKEIKEYEFQEKEAETSSFFNSKRMLFLVAGAAAAILVAALLGVL